MVDIILIVLAVLVICSALGLWAPIEYSKPAPDWVEEAERHRDGWYK